MASKSFRYFVKGIELRGETADVTDNIEGSLWSNSTTQRIKSYIQGAIREIVTADQAQTLTNKTIDSATNTISNIANANISATAAIDASKIANGLVSNAEFQYLDGVTSAVQTQIDGKANTNLGNLTSPTAVNQNLLPDVSATRTIGTPGTAWLRAHAVAYRGPSAATATTITTTAASATVTVTSTTGVIAGNTNLYNAAFTGGVTSVITVVDATTVTVSPAAASTVSASPAFFAFSTVLRAEDETVAGTSSGSTILRSGNTAGTGQTGTVTLSPRSWRRAAR